MSDIIKLHDCSFEYRMTSENAIDGTAARTAGTRPERQEPQACAKRTAALSHVSLHVAEGSVVMLCGQSGCGKTTATRLLNGLIPEFHEGTLTGRRDIAGLTDAAVTIDALVPLVGSVFQNPKTQYFNADTTSELAFTCENLGWQPPRIRARLAEIVQKFELGQLMNRQLFTLSGGQQQRLAVAAAAMHAPRIMIMDEPTSNLDAAAMRGLHDMVAQLKADGVTVVIAEHRLAWCADLVDRYVVFEASRIAAEYSAVQFHALSGEQLAGMGLRALDMEPYRRKVAELTAGETTQYALHTASLQPRRRRTVAGDTAENRPSDDMMGVDMADDMTDDMTAGNVVIATDGLVVGHGRRGRWPGRRRRNVASQAAGVERGRNRDADRSDGNITFSRAIPDLQLSAGRIVGLMGRNGAGKTTLLRTLCGLERPLDGRVLLHGRPVNAGELTRAGFLVMQDVNYQLFADSVREEMMLGVDDARSGSTDAMRRRCDEILSGLDLLELADRHPMSLSGGQKQRLAIASALMCGKEFIMLDEPTSGLDRHHMMQVGALLRQIADEGRAMLVVTHDDELAALWCDAIVQLDDGVMDGLRRNPSQLTHNDKGGIHDH